MDEEKIKQSLLEILKENSIKTEIVLGNSKKVVDKIMDKLRIKLLKK